MIYVFFLNLTIRFLYKNSFHPMGSFPEKRRHLDLVAIESGHSMTSLQVHFGDLLAPKLTSLTPGG